MSATVNNKPEQKKGSGKLIALAVLALLLIIVVSQSIFILYEGESAIVLRFGRIESVHMESISYEVYNQLRDPGLVARHGNITIHTGTGLRFKIPFIDDVVKYTSKLIPYDSPPTEVITRDRHRLLFDNTAVWRIINPVLFFESYGTIDAAKLRINEVLYAQVRVGVGTHDSYSIISDRDTSNAMLRNMTHSVSAEFFHTGIEVLDIRIRRTDLPPETYDSIHGRMNAERHRVAAENRAEGERESLEIRSDTDRQVAFLISDAQRQAEEIRGRGDSEAARIYNEAFSRDPAFFEFYMLLETYRLTIGQGSTLVIPLDSPFAKFLLGLPPEVAQSMDLVVETAAEIDASGDANGDDD